MKKDIIEKIEIPDGYEINIDRSSGLFYIIKISFKDKSLTRQFKVGKKIIIRKDENFLVIESNKATRKEKRIIKTIKSHIKNMIIGLSNPWSYKLEICYSHFPISVSIDKNKKQIIIKNFFGENKPRVVKLLDGVDVEIKGNIIQVLSCDKELAGRQAALIEGATRITNRDRRIFQDGIWIIEKANKPI